jgi:hypothetical protein
MQPDQSSHPRNIHPKHNSPRSQHPFHLFFFAHSSTSTLHLKPNYPPPSQLATNISTAPTLSRNTNYQQKQTHPAPHIFRTELHPWINPGSTTQTPLGDYTCCVRWRGAGNKQTVGHSQTLLELHGLDSIWAGGVRRSDGGVAPGEARHTTHYSPYRWHRAAPCRCWTWCCGSRGGGEVGG